MALISILAMLALGVRYIVAAVATCLGVLFLLDWLVRTRRINPFHPLARAIRRAVDPIVAPVERRIVRAGGLPSSAPIWALVGVIIGGIVLVSGLDFIVQSLAAMLMAVASGPAGIFALLVRLTFGLLRLALIIVVVVSWLPISPFSSWVRWAFSLTEPFLRPLREMLPRVGMFDISPIVAYFLLGMLQWAFLRMVGM